MRKLNWLILFFSPLFAFKFCVLGDRTPLAGNEVFEQVMKEIKVLKPDFIVHLGNLIKGKGRDTSGIIREWNFIKKTFDDLGIPYYLCPGSEDIWDEKSEEIFLRFFNKTFYSFNYDNCHFIILDFSRFPRFSDLPKEMLDWLRDDLSLHRRKKWIFVFGHRPYWRTLKEKFPLHKILSSFGVDFFFSGYSCFYTYHLMDSIHYFQVGPTGARFKEESEEERGAFPNYLLIEVQKDFVNVIVIRPGSILRPDIVTLKGIEEESLTSEKISISPFLVEPKDNGLEKEILVSLENPFSYELRGEVFWVPFSWKVSPPKAKFFLSPFGKGSFPFSLCFKGDLFPLPELVVCFQKDGEKVESISKSLPIKREVFASKFTPGIDGVIEEWKSGIDLFSNESGNKASLKSILFLGVDSLNLYFAVQNYEKKIVARLREKDGLIKEDDFACLLFSSSPDTIFEFSFNPRGFVYDKVYLKEGGKFKRREWDAHPEIKSLIGENYWQAEIALPLSRLRLGERNSLGFNFLRYSVDDSLSLFFQPPISHKPIPSLRIDENSFGILLIK
jgi:hypothetical protein